MGELRLEVSTRRVPGTSAGHEGIKLKRLEKEAWARDSGEEGNEDGELVEGIWTSGIVEKWFADKGYGFLKVRGVTVFCHADRVVGRNWLREGDLVWVRGVEDKAKGPGFWKATEAMDSARWEEGRANREAGKALEVAGRASKVVINSVEKGIRMMELAEDARVRMGSPGNLGIGGKVAGVGEFGAERPLRDREEGVGAKGISEEPEAGECGRSGGGRPWSLEVGTLGRGGGGGNARVGWHT